MRRTAADEAGLSRQVARWTAAILAAVVLAGAAAADEAVSPFPADHRELKHTIGYEAMAAFRLLNRTEGIMPALESSHALAWLVREAGQFTADDVVVINLSGRGDKDILTVAALDGIEI